MSAVDDLQASVSRRPVLFTVGGFAVLTVLFVGGYLLFFRNPYQVLFDKMRVNDAASVVAELDRQKIPYRLEAGGSRILVPAQKVDATRLNILSADLPLKGTVGFELFNKSDMGLTEFAQKINYQRALQGELERTIMALDAVESARVHLSLPDSSIFREDRRPPKASVTLTMRPGRRLSPEMVNGVQNLIAASTPDLEAANVFVLDEHGAIVSENAVGSAASSASGVAATVEQYYAARIRRAVSQVYPDSDLDVSVEVVARRALPVAPALGPDVDAHIDPMRVVPGAATAPSAAADDDLPNALQAWTPAERRFALEVRLSVESPISPQLQQQMKTLAAQAVNLDAAAGDEVVVSTQQGGGYTGSSLFAASDNAEPAQATPIARTSSPTSAWEAILAPVLVILIGIAVFLGWSRGGAEHLTPRKRDEYVRRLKFLLDKEEANASPPL